LLGLRSDPDRWGAEPTAQRRSAGDRPMSDQRRHAVSMTRFPSGSMSPSRDARSADRFAAVSG
jgi:hypothetical protein